MGPRIPVACPLARAAGPLTKTALPSPAPPRTVPTLTSGDKIPSYHLDGEPSAAEVRRASAKGDLERPRSSSEGDGFMAAGAHVNGRDHTVVRLKKVADPPLRHRVVRAVLAHGPGVAKRGSGLTRGPKDHERTSLTSGNLTVNGRGLTGGWGMINGTGMTREPEHHVSRGRFNGSGVTSSSALASRDGMTNGSGLTEGSGMAAGASMTNGSGLTQGQGMTNGNGLVRPPSDELPPLEMPEGRRGVLRRFMGS